jgi:LSD1 subclass zinc finger protein
MSTVRLRRLQADYEKMRAFLQRQPRIRLIQTQGSPPERYQLEFQIRGLREVDEKLQAVANHMVEIALPLSYPRLPPQCRMLTPVFHPNIAPHAICIGDHWNAGEPLWSMVARIGEMIAYQSYNTKSPLNGEAARWVESNQDKLPLDKTNFMLDDAQTSDAPPNDASPPVAQSNDAPPDPMLIPVAGEHVAAPPPIPTLRPAVSPPPLASAPGTAIPMAIPLPPRSAPPVAKLVGVSTAAAAVSNGSGTSAPKATALPAQSAASAPSVKGDSPIFADTKTGKVPAAPNIVIQCGQCGARYSVPPGAAGKKVRCKKCQAILLIPVRPAQQ